MEYCDVKQRDFETSVSKKFKINSLLYPPGGAPELGKIPYFFLKLFLTPSLMNIICFIIKFWSKEHLSETCFWKTLTVLSTMMSDNSYNKMKYSFRFWQQ